MSILNEIIQYKKQEIANAAKRIPLDGLKRGTRQFPLLKFAEALAQPGLQVIAEIKRKSPSSGNIRLMADPVAIAKDYEQNGAAAISVLTDKKYFAGSLEFLQDIKASVSIPVLRKDFIISEYQLFESYVAGADAILLIADVLDAATLKHLYQKATELGLAVLMEVHSRQSLKIVLALNPEIVGVNTRDLTTMEINLNHCQEMFSDLPPSSLKVAESGIQTVDDLKFVANIGYDAALIGTALMKSGAPGETLNSFLKEVQA